MRTVRIVAWLPLFTLVWVGMGCADHENDPTREVLLAPDTTFTESEAVAGNTFRVLVEVNSPRMVQFRAWSSGYLAGVNIVLRDPTGDSIWEQDSLGTSLRLDGVRLDVVGVYALEITWSVGAGVASYRHTILSEGAAPIVQDLVGAMAVGRAGHQATALLDGTVLVTGGHQTGSGLTPDVPNPLTTAELIDPETGRVEVAGALQQARAYHTAVLIKSGSAGLTGRVLLAGGIGSDGDALSSTEIYDPDTGKFTAGPFLPQPRAFLTSLQVSGTVFLDGKIVLGGGEQTRATAQHDYQQGFFSEVDFNPPELLVFDPEVGTIQELSSFGQGRVGATMTLLEDGRILILGGGVDTLPTKPGCVPQDGTICHCSAELPTLCTQHILCETPPCAYTNYTRKDVATGAVAIYNTADGGLTTLTDVQMWRARLGHSASLLPGGLVAIAGGATAWHRSFRENEESLAEYPVSLDSVELFDPLANSFSPLPSLAIPRVGHTAVRAVGGQVILLGGMTEEPGGLVPISLVEAYDFDAGQFEAVAALDTALASPEVVVSEALQRLLVVGGEGPAGPEAVFERLKIKEADVARAAP